MQALTEFIQTARDSRELKRALAVKMLLASDSRAEIAEVLAVSESFLDKWRRVYRRDGVAGLRLRYRGSSGYLAPVDKRAVLAWIRTQTCWDVRRVQAHIWEQYGVRDKSRQSYYALLKEARQSWKKTQHRHPEANEAHIAAKRAEIKKKHESKPRPSS